MVDKEDLKGFHFTIRKLPDGGVLKEIWQDMGDNENTQPGNRWKRIKKFREDPPRDPPSDHSWGPYGHGHI
jgi:hypothetical protein